MELTEKAWKKAKKDSGSKPPTTKLTPALKKFEKARKALESSPDAKTLQTFERALGDIRKALDDAYDLLNDKKQKGKYDKLVGEINVTRMDDRNTMIEVNAWLDEKRAMVEEQMLDANAASDEVAAYDIALAKFEKLRKQPRSLAAFEALLAAVAELQDLAQAVIDDGTNPVNLREAPKMQRQLKILAANQRDLEAEEATYQEAYAEIIELRESVLAGMVSAGTELKRLLASAEADEDARADLIAEAEEVAAAANEQFSPAGAIRKSSDIREAGLHKTEVDQITHYLTDMIGQNKENNALLKAIQALT